MIIAFACLLAVFMLFGVGLLAVKYIDQRTRDRGRKTYRLAFPADMSIDQVIAWIRSISGTLRFAPTRFHGVPTVAFEVVATSDGIKHRLKVPWQHADYVIVQLRSLVPGIRVTPEDAYERYTFTKAVEVGLTHTSRSLRIPSPEATSASILASVQALEPGEVVLLQWVVTPAPPSSPPVVNEAQSHHLSYRTVTSGNVASRDEVNDRRRKLEEPNVMAVLRVGAVASTTVRASHLIYRVRAALASTRTSAVRFHKRWVTKGRLQYRIDYTRAAVVFPMQLSAPELAALVAFPVGSPLIVGLPATIGKQLPPSETIPREGIVIGTSSFAGKERPIAIGYKEAMMHTWCGGLTGTGKSVLLSNMARQIMADGYGLIVMETEGNLYQSVLDYVPKERIKDVILMDVSDTSYPVGFNVLDQGAPLTVIDQIINLFVHKYGKEGMGIWAQEYIYFGLRTLAATPNTSFTDLATLLLPRTTDELEWVDTITRNLSDPELKRWWQQHDNRARGEQQKRVEPVLSRIWQLTSRPELRYIMGQSVSSFQIKDVLEQGKILLINFKGVSAAAASLAGTLMMNAIWYETKNTRKQKPVFVMLDEFADFMDLPIDTESFLAQARKHNVGMVLANQHLTQLKGTVQDAVITNARNKIVLTTNSNDARVLARELGTMVDPIDFTSLAQYEAIAKVVPPYGNATPVTIRTEPPQRSTGNAAAAKDASRRSYSRPVAEVQADIENRHRIAKPAPKERPNIGSDSGFWRDNVADNLYDE